MPSTRSLALGVGAVALVGLQGVAVAQPSVGAQPGLGTRMAIRFLGGLVVSLVLGGALVGLSPEYARETVDDVRRNPGDAFVWGLVVTLASLLALFVLAITVVGLVLAVPAAIVLFVLGVVGNAVTVVWLGTLVGDDAVDGRAVALGAVVVAGLAAVPGLGDLLTTLVGFFGFGAVCGRLYSSHRGDDDGTSPTVTSARAATHRDDL